MGRKERTYICIDLKSFYASVECVERGLDPFETKLVVADPERSVSTICLAVTPAMKRLGVKNRCRIHEIPECIEYITAVPRMQLYMEYSAEIYGIYLSFVAAEDIHVYSIDECFLDVTNYLDLYKVTPEQMAEKLMGAVYEKTGITASAGVGTNLYLAKIAMDIMAKRAEDHIGILDEISYRKALWGHRPLTDFWRIGSGTARQLEKMGIFSMGDLARASFSSEQWLYKVFGIDAELLIDHAWGKEPCGMEEIKAYTPEVHSLSSGQVLMRNYSFEEGMLVAKEMMDLLVLDLVEKKLITDSLTLHVSYDYRTGEKSAHGSIRSAVQTNSSRSWLILIEKLYKQIVNKNIGIRKIAITCNHVQPYEYYQYSFLSDTGADEKEKKIQEAVVTIRNRFGKNALLRGCNLYEHSTLRMRNNQIGGHRA